MARCNRRSESSRERATNENAQPSAGRGPVAWALAPPVTAQIKNPIQAAKDVYKKARAEQQAKKPRQPSAAPGRLHCVSRWGQINVNSEHGGFVDSRMPRNHCATTSRSNGAQSHEGAIGSQHGHVLVHHGSGVVCRMARGGDSVRRLGYSLYRKRWRYCRRAFRKRPVCDDLHVATFSGVPVTTISPPAWPPSGPRSMT